MMCCQKSSQIFVGSDPEILALTRVNISEPSLYEALYSPMIVAVGLLGPLPRSDYPLQAAHTPETCHTSMMCCQKSSQIFVGLDPEIVALTRVNISAPS